jgi:hypothetical protein
MILYNKLALCEESASVIVVKIMLLGPYYSPNFVDNSSSKIHPHNVKNRETFL